MITIGDIPTAPRRLDLAPGSFIIYRPMDSIDREAGLAAMRRFIESVRNGQAALVDYGVKDESALERFATDEDLTSGVASLVALVEFGLRCIVSWEGIADPTGAPAPLNRANLAALLREPLYHSKLQNALNARLLTLDKEGNGSAPLPNGEPAGARPTANHATRSAPPAQRAKGARTARSAPKGSTLS